MNMTTWKFTGQNIHSGYGSGGDCTVRTEFADAATADGAIAIIAARLGATGIEFRHGISSGFHWVLTSDCNSTGQAWWVTDSFPSSPHASAPNVV